MEEIETEFYSWGTRCDAVLWKPETAQSDETVPAVVMCHGFRGVKEWFLPPTAQAFRAAGYGVLTFDYRGFGGSDGVVGSLVPQDQVEDIRSALTFLGSQEWVDETRLGLWGTSFGCSNVVSAAAQDRRAIAVVGQVGIGNVKRAWVDKMAADKRERLIAAIEIDRVARSRGEQGATIDPGKVLDNPQSQAAFEKALETLPQVATEMPLAALERIFEFVPEEDVAAISPRALLLIGAAADLAVPIGETRLLYERAGEPKRLEIWDIGHYEIYEPPWRDRANDLAIEWFDQYLRNDPQEDQRS